MTTQKDVKKSLTTLKIQNVDVQVFSCKYIQSNKQKQ